VTSLEIPHRPAFRANEVCEIAQVQLYVLRSWEAEFPDLGVAKTAAGPRIYRRADVERVLRLKHLLFVDGLTLAGARRRMSEESGTAVGGDEAISDADVAALLDEDARKGIREIKRGLQWILDVLSGSADGTAGSLALSAQPAARKGAAKKTPAKRAAAKGKSKK
jgi:DNA-binding transcriptional MerR regulator